jgi:alpha-ribazole phosphatase
MPLWLVRHAPVAVSGVCYGQHEVPVTLRPEEAADLVAGRWQTLAVDVVPELWSSPWSRAREVGEALARRWRIALHLDARLSELSFGEWEGRRFDDIRRDDGERFERWAAAFEVESPPCGETVGDLRRRVAAWLEERTRASQTVLAVTHAGVIRAARSLALDVEYADIVAQPVEHLVPEPIELGDGESKFGVSRAERPSKRH